MRPPACFARRSTSAIPCSPAESPTAVRAALRRISRGSSRAARRTGRVRAATSRRATSSPGSTATRGTSASSRSSRCARRASRSPRRTSRSKASTSCPGHRPLQQAEEVDRDGTRIGVITGSAYDLFLTRGLKHASLVRLAGPDEVLSRCSRARVDLIAGVKPALEADARRVPGSRLLPRGVHVDPAGDGHAARARGRCGLHRAHSSRTPSARACSPSSSHAIASRAASLA